MSGREARDEAGRAIVALMDKVGFECHAAAWIFDPDADTWRFLLVTPLVETCGPRWIYERLTRLFRHHPLPAGVTPLDIHVIDSAMEMALVGSPENASPDVGATFYRRLPMAARRRRHDNGQHFDTHVHELEAA